MKVPHRVSVSLICGVLAACAASSPQPAADWHSYQAESQLALEQARYQDALGAERQAWAGAQRSLAPDASELATVLLDLGNLEERLGHYADADLHLRRALSLRRARYGEDSAESAEALFAVARSEHAQSKIADAERDLRTALAMQEKYLPKDDPATGATLIVLGRTLADDDQIPAAQAMLERGLAIREQHPGVGQVELADALNQAAYVAVLNGDDDGAAKLTQRAQALLDLPAASPFVELSLTLDISGSIDLDRGAFGDAEPKLRRALDIVQKAYGPDHQDTANVLDDLARLYDDEGHFKEAEDHYLRSIAVYTRALGPNDLNVANVTDNLANMQDLAGRYPQAEANFKHAIAIDETWGKDRTATAYDYNNLAQLYESLGRYAEAEPLMLQSLAIFRKDLPPDHPNIGTLINNLSVLYSKEDDYKRAEPFALEALERMKKAYGDDNVQTANEYNNLAEIYKHEGGRDAEAEPLYLKALAIYRKQVQPGHPMLARQMLNLADFYNDAGKFAAADRLFPRSLELMEKAYGPENPYTEVAVIDYAREQFAEGRNPRKAAELFDRDMRIVHRDYQEQFPYMNEQDRLQYVAATDSDFDEFFSFCIKYHDSLPDLAGKMYDVLLWKKGFVASSIAAMRAKIAASADPGALEMLDKLTASKNQLASLLNNPGDDRAKWQSAVAVQQQQVDELERQLLRRSSALAQDKALQNLSWHDVQKALQPGEAAVEYVRVKDVDGRLYSGGYYYVALVVTRATRTAPQFIVVGKAKDLEADPVADYAAHLSKIASNTQSGKASFYGAFWHPLDSALKGMTRVYLSPDGILNQASLGIVADDQGRLLMERYDLRIVPSTRDLLRTPAAAAADTAVLLGGPSFDLAPDKYLDAVASLSGPAAGPETRYAGVHGSTLPLARGLAGGHCSLPNTGILCPLPGAAEEVAGIDDLLSRKQWQASLYQGDRGLEEAIQAVHHPRLLHIATHGFFLPDQKTLVEDPMLRSGLYFAGADNTLAGNLPPEGADNGVLTAYEAEQLDLEGTELVVLSACDTGLGTSQSGEGVFGLNRALQEAGAQAVMMSMWSVPDQETRELMQLFYQNWLSGMEKHEALRQAQLKEREVVKARYGKDLPYYWGAFVMVGR